MIEKLWYICIVGVLFVSCSTIRLARDTNDALPPEIPEETVVAWFSFDATLEDKSRNRNDGVLVGSGFAAGREGMGVALAGKNSSYVYFPDQEEYHIFEPTVEAWIKLKGTARSNTIISENIQGADDDGKGFLLDVQDRRLRFVVGDDSREWKYVSGSTRLEMNTWYHVVGVYQSGNLKVFVNGELDGLNGVGPVGISYIPKMRTGPKPSVLYIGIRHSAHESPPNYVPDLLYPFDGVIDEVRIFNRGLTESEVKALYHSYVRTF